MSHAAHVGDIGTTIRMTIRDQDDTVVDLSTATTLQLIMKKGDNTVETKTASLYTDGTDGILKYITISGDFDNPGIYSFQGKVVIGSGTWYSSIDTWKIDPNLI